VAAPATSPGTVAAYSSLGSWPGREQVHHPRLDERRVGVGLAEEAPEVQAPEVLQPLLPKGTRTG
jgi:hypothetical protein